MTHYAFSYVSYGNVFRLYSMPDALIDMSRTLSESRSSTLGSGVSAVRESISSFKSDMKLMSVTLY